MLPFCVKQVDLNWLFPRFPLHGSDHGVRHGFNLRNYDAVAGLFSDLRVGHDDFERVGKSLQTQHFPRSHSSFAVHRHVVIRAVGAQSAGKHMYTDVAAFVFVQNHRTARNFLVLFFKLSSELRAEVIAQKMFFVDFLFRFQNIGKRFSLGTVLRKFKRIVFLEADKNYPLSFLRNSEIETVEHLVMYKVVQVFQALQNNSECSSFVVRGQLFYVFQ